MCVWFYVLVESLGADRSVMAAWWLPCSVAMCVDTCGFATWCCKKHCHGCINVAWDSCWGGSRSTKPCVFQCFPCKVAAAGGEGQLLCEGGAAWIVSSANWSLLPVLQHVDAECIVMAACVRGAAKRIVMVLWMLHGAHWRRDPVLEPQFLALLRVVQVCFVTQYLEIAL